MRFLNRRLDGTPLALPVPAATPTMVGDNALRIVSQSTLAILAAIRRNPRHEPQPWMNDTLASR